MPGSSLWLVPPPSHPLHGIITTLITTTLPSKFPSEAGGGGGGSNPVLFATHMTLTSEILPATYNKDSGTPNLKHPPTDEEKQHAQTWLDALPLPPANKVHVRLDRVDTQDVFFRRCFIRVLYEGVEDIVGIAREYSVTRGSSGIHDGAGSGDDAGSPISGATREWLARWKEAFGPHVSLIYGSTPITEDRLAQISAAVEEAGVVLGASHLAAESGAGWDGGVVWLVPTDRPIGDWKPIATRTLV